MMKPHKPETGAPANRRDFLKLAAIGAPAAAAASALAPKQAAAEAAPSALGMRKTAHVKAYLDSCRF